MRDRLLKKTLRDRYVITLKSAQTFEGILDDWDRNRVKLINAFVVTEAAGQAGRVPVSGDLYLDRDNIAYSQVPPR